MAPAQRRTRSSTPPRVSDDSNKSNTDAGAPQPTAMNGHTKNFARVPRPYEFGGNIGTGFWTFFIPAAVYYSYGLNVVNKGEPTLPDSGFWKKLIWQLPDGISIQPTSKGALILFTWIFVQLVFQQYMPGKIEKGVVLKNGNRLHYKLNGWRSWCATWIIVCAAVASGHVDPTILFKNFGSLMTWAVIFSYLLALYLYVHFGLLWRRWVDSPEFEVDWGVFKLSDFFHDYFIGTARNPRILHFLGYPVDLKFFFEARPGLILWVLLNWSNVAAMYQGCQIQDSGVVCAENGSWSRVPWAIIIISASHTYYIFDYFWNEPAILTTTDIRHDPFGFMLAYGDMGYLPWMYSNSFSLFLVCVQPHYQGSVLLDCVGVGGWLLCMIGFRLTNIQKHNFRTHAAAHNNDPSGYMVWGKPATWIKTKEGSLILTSGWWGLCRHPNYMPDLMMAVVWMLTCAGHKTFPLVPLGYVMYFWAMDIHRFLRDERRCKEKYKDDWDKYVETVPYGLVPGLF